MGELIDIGSARALVADQALWPRVRDFLWNFAPQIHPSWIDELETQDDTAGSLAARLMSSPRVRRYVLDLLDVKPCFHAFPKDDFSRLLLLDGTTLESLVKWIGALACVDTLRGVTDGASVRALKAVLPGIYPEVFGYAAYFKPDSEGPKGGSRQVEAGLVVSAGWHVLHSSLSHLPEGLLRRLSLKLPKAIQTSDACQETSNLPSFDFRLISKLLKLKFPEAYALCCS